MKKNILLGFVILFVVCYSFSQQINPAGEDFYQYSSASLLGSSSTFASDAIPDIGNINPAAPAKEQRTTLSLYYTGGFSSSSYGLNGFSLGAAFPSRFAVFSSYLSYIGSGFDDIDLGSTFAISLTASKEIFDDLLFGLSIRAITGNADIYDWGLLSDIGFLFLLNNDGILKDDRLGFVLSGMGKGYTPFLNREAIPPVFTPFVTYDAFLIKSDSVDLRWANSLSIPFFQNLILKTGLGIDLFNTFNINMGYTINLQELIDDNLPLTHTLPSVGLNFSIPVNFNQKKGLLAEQGWNKSEVAPHFSVFPIGDIVVFSTGVNVPLGVVDSTPPKINADISDEIYISPNNDGEQDTLEFDFGIDDERYIINYAMLIEDENGNIVRKIENKEKRPETKDIKTFFMQLIQVKEGVPVPDKLRWDGTDDSGQIVEDGRYYVYITASDDNGNKAVTDKKEIVVDKTFPEINVDTVSEDAKIFSPNGDGLKDVIKILQTGSVEELWTGKILDQDGNVKKEFSWKNTSPTDFEWDGTDDTGVLCPDGVYTYVIASTDKAGNFIEKELDNIIISTEPTPVSIKVNAKYFSPNGDGKKDTITFDLDIPVKKGIVSWTFEVFSQENKKEYVKTDTSNPPLSILFDGKDSNGVLMPEGGYTAKLTVRYKNGNTPTSQTPVFYLDMTPPQVSVEIPDPVFSPNGDGRKDVLIIKHSNSTIESAWTGAVFTEKGQKVRTFEWKEAPPSVLRWDGITDGTGLALDGRYYYVIQAVDEASNSFKSEPVFFVLSTEKTPVLLSVNHSAFSPNGDGVKDTISFFPQLKTQQLLDKYELTIYDSNKNAVKTFSGTKKVPSQIVWDGKNSNNEIAFEGTYSALLSVYYSNGNLEKVSVDNIVIDITPPVVSLDIDNKAFSPNNDGIKDFCNFTQSSTEEAEWKAYIKDADDKTIVLEKKWNGVLDSFSWNGKDLAGNVIDFGKFYYVVEGVDQAGNSVIKRADDIIVDIRPVKIIVTTKEKSFSPNNDGILDKQTITMYTQPSDAVKSWKLELVRDGKTEKIFEGDKQTPVKEIVWDGYNSNNRIEDGVYIARYTVSLVRGEEMQEETKPFIIDTTPPVLNVSVSPQPFSPDNDGVDDEVFFDINTSDLSGIVDWEISITDPYDNLFTSFSGKGMPAPQIIWDGRSKNGELVSSAEDYKLIFTATDLVGNTAKFETIVPVDVLVIREGNKLKIKISSIYFEPNSSELVMDDSEEGKKNKEIIAKLVKIFNKYGNYNIRIEGHAVNLSGTEKEEIEELVPLSLKRADSVKEALISMGLNEKRITTAGIGGREPLVPHSDVKNRWKNRRVEFILIKQ